MLSSENTYLIFPIIGAVLGAMLWLSYFKRIDSLEKETNTSIIITFIIGYLTPSVSLWLYFILEILGFNFNGTLLNDFTYSILGIGLVEELSKLLGVFVTFKILKKKIDEPIDYLFFAGIVALGFSIRENFIYYNNYGSQLVTGRTLISCLVHIINTSICVYGLYRYKIFKKGNHIINGIIGVTTAIVSHGLFDFFLLEPIIGKLTPFLSTIVYLIGINFWIQMFNNCINFSPYFSYNILSKSTKLYKSVMYWYAGIIILEFCYVWYYGTISFALTSSIKNLLNEGVLLLIVALRISRLKINHLKYYPIKIQSPIYYTNNNDEDFNILGLIPLKIRGENEAEFQFMKYIGKEILIGPVSKSNSIISKEHKCKLIKKYFLKNDVASYLIDIYNINGNGENKLYILKPKTSSTTLIEGKYPVAMLLKEETLEVLHENVEYIYVKDLQ